jgi:hypothetical protein
VIGKCLLLSKFKEAVHGASLPPHILGGMKVTLSIDQRLAAQARKKARILGKSLNQLISECLQIVVGEDDPERSIEEFKQLSGHGNSRAWRFDRNEIHARL